jgi:hypothetical protein
MILFVEEPKKRLPCPVCCGYLGRDYDLLLAISSEGESFWICESCFYDDLPCDFYVPTNLTNEEIERKTKEIGLKMTQIEEK